MISLICSLAFLNVGIPHGNYFYVTILMQSGLEGQNWPLFCVSFSNFIPKGIKKTRLIVPLLCVGKIDILPWVAQEKDQRSQSSEFIFFILLNVFHKGQLIFKYSIVKY